MDDQTQLVSGVAAPAAAPVKKGKKFKIWPIIFLVIILAALGGGAFAGYQYYYLPQQEKGLLKKMYQKMSEVKSLKYDFEVRADVKTEPNPSDIAFDDADGLAAMGLAPSTTTSFHYVFSGQGEGDFSDEKNPRAKVDLLVSGNLDSGSQEPCDGLACLLSDFKLGLSAVSLDKIFFLKISELPAVPFFDTSVVLNKWVKFDTSTGTLGQLEEVRRKLEEETAKRELSEEETAKVKEIFGQHDIMKIVKRLPDEKIDNQAVYHVSFNLNKEELKAALLESNQAVGGKIIPEDQKYDFNKVFDDLKIPDSEAWVGKKDYYLYRFSISSSTYVSSESGKTDAKFSFIFNLSGFNQPVSVEAPVESVPFEKLIADIFGISEEQMLGAMSGETAKEKSRNARRLASIKQVQTALELYYNDWGEYPQSVDFSGQASIASGTITYMTVVPNNPEPQDDGACPLANYSYRVLDGGKNYEISYCLGEDTGGIKAGPHMATMAGIAEADGFGVSQEQSLTITSGEAGDGKSRDYRRLSDVKQIQTALELYYNDWSEYPQNVDFSGQGSIASGTIIYMTLVPSNPEPQNDGSCPTANYSYSVLDGGENYWLIYCLGGETMGISAGRHMATFAGVDEGAPLGDAAGNGQADTDKDGLNDVMEGAFGTDPYNTDTDGDGFSDGDEVNGGYNPNGPGKLVQ